MIVGRVGGGMESWPSHPPSVSSSPPPSFLSSLPPSPPERVAARVGAGGEAHVFCCD